MKVKNTKSFEVRANFDLISFLSERSVSATRASAYLYLLSHRQQQETTFKRNNRSCTVKPGQAALPVTQLVTDWKWDRKTVQRFLDGMAEIGYLQFSNHVYWTIFDFPKILTDQEVEMLDRETLIVADGKPSDIAEGKPQNQAVGKPSTDSEAPDSTESDGAGLPDIRFEAPPLLLDETTADQIREIHGYLQEQLPKLDIPPYSDRTEKAICFLFVYGMKKDMALMKRYIDTVANDPYKNGEIAEMTGNTTDQESFESLFACVWQEILFETPTQ